VERLPCPYVLGHRPAAGSARLTGYHPCYAVCQTKDAKYVTVGAIEHFWCNLCVQLGVAEFIPDKLPRRHDPRSRGLKLIASPLKLSDTPPAGPAPPRELGRHTDEVPRWLGYSASAIEGLRANRIV
jgi:crotonobetainyl-CoA:carnitine CoA-transferase CaiB-like acyl-CoA transferase